MKACVLIPSYNSGPLLRQTVAAALNVWEDVFVVIDGSKDGSDEGLEDLAGTKRLRVHRLAENGGKGAAILKGITLAEDEGFTHALAMDADGQHPADHIKYFMEMGAQYPEALVLGVPVFDEFAPALRVQGRKISNWWANVETCWWGVHDSLFGMRLYPIAPLKKVFSETLFARRFDFDPEVAVRLCWKRLPVINLKTPVRYLSLEQGGVSQFRYLRDNILLTGMHIRLFTGFFLRLPILLFRGKNPLKNLDPFANA
ncbi:MAG: glycosyltransferase family 2 protein [Akkermansiaceae bacterium]|jgi:glycosyltransferase involved in cell wall biosynthesis|nr:glycosyltransferase family 2 protein [Luteolibacter sp.]